MFHQDLGTQVISRILEYIDDIAVQEMHIEKRMLLLDLGLTQLKRTNLTVSLRKCLFLTRL